MVLQEVLTAILVVNLVVRYIVEESPHFQKVGKQQNENRTSIR